MGGLKPLFNPKMIKNIMDDFQEEIDNKIITALQYVGEEFVNKARSIDTYRDRTGNLRSSIGYIILKDGIVTDSNFTGKSKGRKQGLKFAKEVAEENPKGYVLIGVAGMKYACYVEAKGYDVISGSVPKKNILKDLFSEIVS